MESLFAKPNLKLLRRFLAVVLTLLSLLFLFWPAMVAYSADYREDRLDYYAERYREYEDYSRSDAKAAARAYVAENNVMGYSFLFS